MKKCLKCNHLNYDDKKFCIRCGYALNDAPTVNNEPVINSEPVNNIKVTPKKSYLWEVLLVVVILVGIVILFITSLKGNKNDKLTETEREIKENTGIMPSKLSAMETRVYSFVDSLEYYAAFVQANEGVSELEEFNEEIPTETCIYKNEKWNDACEIFMTAVERHNRAMSADEAIINIETSGKISNATLIYGDIICKYENNTAECHLNE